LNWTRRIPAIIAVSLGTFLFLASAYRAATQDVTVDESYTYIYFASLPFWKMWQVYGPNHHILHTIFCHISTTVLPLSEFSLRLPALLGGCLYLAAAYNVCRQLFTRSWLFLGAFALLTLNPFILDHLSVARGYGLASAGWLWALYWMIQIVARDRPWASHFEVARIGTVLGLAMAANLTYTFLSIGALGVLVIVLAAGSTGRSRLLACAYLMAPAIIVVGVLVIPIVVLNREGFTFGVTSASDTVVSLTALSFFHKTAAFTILDLPSSIDSAIRTSTAASSWILVLITLGSASSIAWSIYRFRRGSFGALPLEDRFVFLLGTQLLLAIIGAAASHVLFHVPYPTGRTGLYGLIGYSLLLPVLISAVRGPRWFTGSVYGLFVLLAGACTARYIQEFKVSNYAEWKYDATSKQIFSKLRDYYSHSSLQRPARIGCTERLAAPFEFYRRATKGTWVEPFPVYPENELAQLIEYGVFDYVALVPDDQYVTTRVNLTPLWKDAVTGAEIGTRVKSESQPPGLVVGAGAGPIRRDPLNCVDDSDERIRFTGIWWRDSSFTEPLNHTITYTSAPGATLEFPFTGTRAILYYTGAFNRGRAEIQIDGMPRVFLDEYSPATVWRSRFAIDTSPGPHTLRIFVLGKKDPRSQDSVIDVDCLAVEP
jgi:hypothetical protein